MLGCHWAIRKKWSSKWGRVKREVLGHLDGVHRVFWGGVRSDKQGKIGAFVTLGKNGQAGRTARQRHRGRSVLEVLAVWLDCSKMDSLRACPLSC